MIYDITSVGTYREREVPPSPKLVTTGSRRDDADAGLPLLQRLQDFLGVAGLLDPYEQQQLGQERGRGSGVGGGAARRLRTEAGSGRPGSRHGAQPPGSAPAAGGGQAGPRPYFWRLQQRLQAGAYRPGAAAAGVGGATAEGPVSEHDYVLLWRRQIYDQVRALGMHEPCSRLMPRPWARRALPSAGAAHCCLNPWPCQLGLAGHALQSLPLAGLPNRKPLPSAPCVRSRTSGLSPLAPSQPTSP